MIDRMEHSNEEYKALRAEQREKTKALEAITSLRILDTRGLLSPEEKASITEKLMNLYGKHLSPLRTEQAKN